MAYDRFMIAPLTIGLESDVRPWMIPDEAFSRLNNAYVFRGRVRKRFGSYLLNGGVDDSVAQLYSRVRIAIATTDGSGNAAGTAPGAIFKIGQVFSVGDTIFTVYQANGAMLSTGTATGTYNTATGAYTITGADPASDLYFYPAEPIMGLITYETASVNDEPVYAFDTQFAYEYVTGGWQRLGTAIWTGTNSQFFWGYTYRGVQNYDKFLFVTNFNTPDQIKYWNGTTWATINPIFNAAGDTIETCRIIVPFKNRLLFLNTVEDISGTDQSFVNRCRYSQNGDPTAVNAFREDIPGLGGYIDNVATQEQIISCEFLKDRLIVFFERSTWELAYTGNEVLPFVWQQINTELGAESTFSVVPFDKVILGVGNVGIHACNGSNVERIDEKIPDTVFEVANDNEGVFRVYGIRDYYVEMVYWAFPSPNATSVFPNRVLVYNYKTGSWAFNDDSITAFGYFQNPIGEAWNTTNDTWQQAEYPWSSATLQAKFRQVIAGNQEGFTFIVDSEESRNAPSLQITNLTVPAGVVTLVVIDHNLSVGDFVNITNLNGLIGPFLPIYEVDSVIDSNTITIIAPDIGGAAGTYTGGGTIARVSRVDIKTKQYNFYLKNGRNLMVNKVDFFVDSTEDGAFTVDVYPSSANYVVDSKVIETSPYPSIPFEQEQDQLWHPVYTSAEGELIQLRLYFSDDQMLDSSVSFSDFQLHAMTFYSKETSNRLQ